MRDDWLYDRTRVWWSGCGAGAPGNAIAEDEDLGVAVVLFAETYGRLPDRYERLGFRRGCLVPEFYGRSVFGLDRAEAIAYTEPRDGQDAN